METFLVINQFVLIGAAAALLFRIRGGLFALSGTAPGRVIFAVGMSALSAYAAWDLWMLLSAPLWYASAVLGWGGALDLGRNEGTWAEDAQALLLRGVWWTYLPGLLFILMGHSPVYLLPGLLCPVAYELGYRIPLKVKGAYQGPELAEVIFGAMLGIGLLVASRFG